MLDVRELRAQGGEVQTKARVSEISGGGPWVVTAGDAVYEARVIINAAGAWADEVARLAGVAVRRCA